MNYRRDVETSRAASGIRLPVDQRMGGTIHAFKRFTGPADTWDGETMCGLPFDLTPGSKLRAESRTDLISCRACGDAVCEQRA